MKLVVSIFLMFSGTAISQIDTLYYFDFADSIPSGWIAHDSTNNGFNWVHTYSGVEAVYNPQSYSDLNSSSKQNGWLMFHAAYYNTDTTGGLSPVSPLVYMNATVVSSKLDFSSEPDVYLSVQHYFHTLSSPSWGSLELGVSTDSVNWTIYDMHTGSDSPLNVQNGIEKLYINISPVAGLSPEVWIRFHFRNLAWHFWTIDDLVFSRNQFSNGIFNVNSNALQSIYPNPAKHILYAPIGSYRLFAMDGRLVANGYSSGSIDVSSLNSGLFLLFPESFNGPFRFLKE